MDVEAVPVGLLLEGVLIENRYVVVSSMRLLELCPGFGGGAILVAGALCH